MSRRANLKSQFLLASFCSLSCAAANAAVITVNVLTDSGTATTRCELRSAIKAANDDIVVDACSAGSGNDVIEFSVAGSIILNDDLPEIDWPVEINGPGREILTIDGDATYRQFSFVTNSGISAVRDLTLLKGNSAANGGCLSANGHQDLVIADVLFGKCNADVNGGAAYIVGSADISRSVFNSNSAGPLGGAIFFSADPSDVRDSTFESNTATAAGGVFINQAQVNITRSTFNDNSATGSGGAIGMTGNTSIGDISHSTLSGNKADSDADGGGSGGGIDVSNASLVLANTIVAGNLDLSASFPLHDIAAQTATAVTSNGHNFIGANEGTETDFVEGYPNASSDYVGSNAAPLDADLLALANYGGTTKTMPPADSSPVIDLGSCAGEVADQRGYENAATGLRINDMPPANADDGCDIGAVELPLVPELVFLDGFEDE